MIRIFITKAAYGALIAGMNDSNVLEPQRARNRDETGYFIWLSQHVLNHLIAFREPGETVSQAILRAAEYERELDRVDEKVER